jgi:amino acid permease
MVTFLPISSPFIRFAGRFVDDAFGFAAGWNFFVFEAALVPFEIVACNVIIGFWSDVVPTGAIIAIVLVLYAYVNNSLFDLWRFHTFGDYIRVALKPCAQLSLCSPQDIAISSSADMNIA